MEEVGVVITRHEADFLRFCWGAVWRGLRPSHWEGSGPLRHLAPDLGSELSSVCFCFLHGVYIIVQHPLNIVHLVFERRRLRVPKVAQQAQLLVVSFLQDLTTNYPL